MFSAVTQGFPLELAPNSPKISGKSQKRIAEKNASTNLWRNIVVNSCKKTVDIVEIVDGMCKGNPNGSFTA